MSNIKRKNSLSRRHFLQVSALGTAAILGKWGLDLSPEQAASLAARRQAGTLRVAWQSPASLDPAASSADTEIAFLNAVYDYLIDTDASSNLIPRLAEDWQISDDGLQVTLNIREGVTFHNGDPLTVDDVLWTINYLIENSSFANSMSAVEDISAGDGNTVVFTLSEPQPDFLFMLSDNRLVILQADTDPATLNEEFNGTGPFVVDEYLAGDRAVFSANPDYWGDVSLESLEFIYFEDTEAAKVALEGGVVDVLLRLSNPAFLELSGNQNFNAIDIPTNGFDVARLRTDQEPGSDERVQQAFKLATDHRTIYQNIQLGFGALGKDSPIGPLYGDFYNAELPLPEYDEEENPARAAELLEEAGYPDGLDLTIYVPQSGDRVAFAQVLKSQWEKAGIRVEIEPVDESTYYSDSPNNWLDANLGITGWGSRPTPQFYMENAVKTGARWNEAHYSNERVDELIEIAGTSTDHEERVAAYHEIQEILLESGPYIIPYFFAQFMVNSADVSGIELAPFAGRTNFHTATL